jgi:hypothetical protein
MAAWVWLLLSPAMVQATVTPLAYWRMGEHDTPMIFFGGTLVATNLTDETGHHPLTVYGTVGYYTNVSVVASNTTGSSVSAGFLGGAWATNTIVSALTNDFGIECFVKSTDPSTEQIIAYNGHASFSGWGMMIHQTNYCGLFGGVAFIGAMPVVTNVWVHLALVRASGTTTFYVNGVAEATTTQAPNIPATEFALGAAPQVNSAFFTGYLDEVRVFTFTPGKFSTDDLLLNNVGPPIVTTLPASQVTGTNAMLNGTVNPNGVDTGYWFILGTTTNYELGYTSEQGIGATRTTIAVSNLVYGWPGTTYHFALRAYNTNGLVTGADQVFTTSDLLPTVATLAASAVNVNGATLNANVDPNGGATSVQFEWGTTTTYGNITPIINFPASNSTNAASSVISLLPFSTYHFRVDASNSQGTVFGNDRMFATPGEPPTVTTLPASNLTASSAAFNGTVNPNGAPTSYWIEWYPYWFQLSWSDSPTNTLPGTNAALAVSELVSNLSFPSYAPIFYCALVASNAFGTSTGATIKVNLPGVYPVDNRNDTLDVSSLRGAISAAPSGGVISLNSAGGTYYLDNGELLITNNLTLIGALPMPVIQNQTSNGVFNIASGAVCYMANLTIENGLSPAGGAVLNNGSLVISNCYFLNNQGQPVTGQAGGPGGILNYGTLLALNCAFTGNNGATGGIQYDGQPGGAGAIDNYGTLVITNGTFYGNTGGAGGRGAYSADAFASPASGGQGGSGAVDNFGSMTLASCTIAGNKAGNGGGPGWVNAGFGNVYGSPGAAGSGGIFSSSGTWSLDNTVVADPPYTEVALPYGGSLQYSLVGGGYLSSFGPLDYGSAYYPPVLPLLPNSPEINAGDNSLAGTDERGLPRRQGDHVDIGAYESALNLPVPTQLAGLLLPGSGYMQLNFSNPSNVNFTVLGTTNIALPLADWIPLGPATEITPGQYQFTDPDATNFPQRFYLISSP